MANYSNGKILIPNVTGNLVINITAVPSAPVTIPITWQSNKGCNYTIGETLAFEDANNRVTSDFIAVSPQASYQLTGLESAQSYAPDGYQFKVIACDSSNVIKAIPYSSENWKTMETPVEFTVPAGCTKIVFRFGRAGGTYVDPALAEAVLYAL